MPIAVASGDAVPALTEFEAAREARIARNRAVLERLGLQDACAALQPVLRGSKRAHPLGGRQGAVRPSGAPCSSDADGAIEPSRRSRRLAAQPPECAPMKQLPLPSDQLAVRRRAPPPPLVVRTSAPSNAPPEAHDSHNKHRIASMSERALITRAWRITNLAKLESFVYTLRELGNREEVLAEAVAALTWRTTGVPPEESSSPATGKGAMNG